LENFGKNNWKILEKIIQLEKTRNGLKTKISSFFQGSAPKCHKLLRRSIYKKGHSDSKICLGQIILDVCPVFSIQTAL